MGRLLKKTSELFGKFCNAWPGEKYFGIYRFLPIFFAAGAMLEFTMIKFKFKEANFYSVFNNNRAQEVAEELYIKRKYGIE